jgi:hypothetical protein
LNKQIKLITTTCPICGENEIIKLTAGELAHALNEHTLITKAISHSKNGHVLTLYIDGEGIVRRKYCFDLVKNHKLSLKPFNLEKLDSLFDKMLEDSLK